MWNLINTFEQPVSLLFISEVVNKISSGVDVIDVIVVAVEDEVVVEWEYIDEVVSKSFTSSVCVVFEPMKENCTKNI